MWQIYLVVFLVAGIEKVESWIRKRQGWPQLTKRQVFARGLAAYLVVAFWFGYQRGEFAAGLGPLLELARVLGSLALVFGLGWLFFHIPLDYGRKGDHRRFDP